jgi:hypothetical protein
MPKVPAEWMPPCFMQYIVLHWTAGAYKASAVDREHYHIMIEGDGTVVRGDHEIDDNVITGDGDYAAHARKFNTRAIGLSVCCMANADDHPFDPGAFPMTEVQWRTMAEVAAELARFYNIPVTRKTVLGHGEIQGTHGVMQNGKWDPMVLPWAPTLTKQQVGDLFRAEVMNFLT